MKTLEKMALVFFIIALFGVNSEDGFSVVWVCLSVFTGFVFIVSGGLK